MFDGIRTGDLDFDAAYLSALPDFEPCLAHYRERINRVRDHSASDAKVVFGNSIGDAIACLAKKWDLRRAIPDGLLNRVDAQMHAADLTPIRAQLSFSPPLAGHQR
jgi:hypothetical protein